MICSYMIALYTELEFTFNCLCMCIADEFQIRVLVTRFKDQIFVLLLSLLFSCQPGCYSYVCKVAVHRYAQFMLTCLPDISFREATIS